MPVTGGCSVPVHFTDVDAEADAEADADEIRAGSSDLDVSTSTVGSVLTIAGLQFGGLLAGAVIVENVFSYPGVGRLLLDAVTYRDVPVLQAVTLVTALVYSLANLVADVLYAQLNPTIRYR